MSKFTIWPDMTLAEVDFVVSALADILGVSKILDHLRVVLFSLKKHKQEN